MFTHDGALDDAVHGHSEFKVNVMVPDPAAGPRTVRGGLRVAMQPLPLWVMVKVIPAMVNIPVRVGPLGFAETE